MVFNAIFNNITVIVENHTVTSKKSSLSKIIKKNVFYRTYVGCRFTFKMYNSGLCKLAQEQNIVDDHNFFMHVFLGISRL
jgi:hypothetical protein